MAVDLDILLAGSASLGFSLDDAQVASFERYIGLLLTEERRFSGLCAGEAAAMWARHCLDALTIVLALPDGPAEPAQRCLDLGSGAGIPGIPLAIAFPHWHVTLLEGRPRKVRFLELARERLPLSNVRVAGGRAQELSRDPLLRAAHDLCVARAVAPTSALLALALPFVRLNGRVIMYKGARSVRDELDEAESARLTLGASSPTLTPAAAAGSIGGCLVCYRKVAETPSAVPQ